MGCGTEVTDNGGGGSDASNDSAAAAVARDDGTLSCALGGVEEFTRSCDIERLSNDEGKQMIFRHPDGGFRRFLVVTDGRALVAADGADDAIVTIIGENRIEVQVENDRYQLPARVADKDKDDG
ncbi:MAG: hypothetical protein AAFX04_05985 [Pseudomonadota bacterium]